MVKRAKKSDIIYNQKIVNVPNIQILKIWYQDNIHNEFVLERKQKQIYPIWSTVQWLKENETIKYALYLLE